MAFFLLQDIVHISERLVVWSYLQVKQQKREVEMVWLDVTTFMKPQISPLSLITYMFVIEVLVPLKSQQN